MKYLYFTLLVLGLVLLFYAVSQLRKTNDLLTIGVKTEATIIDLIEVKNKNGKSFKPILEFNDFNNETFQFDSRISSKSYKNHRGLKWDVVYNPEDPSQVKVASFWGLYTSTIIPMIFAFPLIIIGGGYFIYLRALG